MASCSPPKMAIFNMLLCEDLGELAVALLVLMVKGSKMSDFGTAWRRHLSF